MRTKLVLALLVVGLAVVLSACGYQLRQEAVLIDGLHQLVWEAEVNADAFFPELRGELANYQALISREPADVLITLHELETTTSVLGKVRSNRATAIWSVTNAWGERILYRQISTAVASEANAESVKAKKQLQSQMFQSLAERFVDQLSRITAEQLALKPEPSP